MKDNLKYILGILVALIVLVVVGYFIFNKPASVDHSTSNTKTVTTEEVTTVKNTFSIEQVKQIKRALTDSLAKVYGSIIKSLKPVTVPEGKDTSFNENYSYISEVDSSLFIKDSSGSLTDAFVIKSVFISSTPFSDRSYHKIKFDHTSFRKETRTDFRSYDTIYVYQSRGFWERFIISPNLSAGYGLFNKKFDLYAGIGLNFEFNAFEIFSSNKK